MAARLLQTPWLAAALALSAAACDSAPSPTPTASSAPSAAADGVVRVKIQAVKGAFEPATVHLRQGKPGMLEFTRVVDSDCVNAVKMPWADKPFDLPMNEAVSISVDTSKAGTFTYSCWMNMVHGRVVIDPP